jgi:hypothetical protein
VAPNLLFDNAICPQLRSATGLVAESIFTQASMVKELLPPIADPAGKVISTKLLVLPQGE